jgi:hypothetical protein
MDLQNIPVPVAGEPIDMTFLTSLTTYLNQINAKLVSDKRSMSSLDGSPRYKLQTDDVVIWTGKTQSLGPFKPVTSLKSLERVNWSVQFDTEFYAIPIVMAIPYCDTTDGGTISSNSIWLHKITQTAVYGKFKFNESPRQEERVHVHVIAIGPGLAR